jgi:hypothetical protein
MPNIIEVVRAEALFASRLQSSESPAASEVRRAVAGTLAQLGTAGCAVQVAGDFGDHPEAAVARMRWALATVSVVYPRRWVANRPTFPLALAYAAPVFAATA